MADNFLYIPEINPVIFFDVDRTNIDKYFTKHFDKWLFSERLLDWQSREDYCQPWQVDDIIYLQFESTFDPIIVKLLDSTGTAVITLPALIGLPHEHLPNTWSFEVSMSLAGLDTGCYRLQITAGTGDEAKTLISDCQYISAEPMPNTICLEYWHSAKYHKDVIFASGIQFQYRVYGHLGFLDKPRADVFSRNQQNSIHLLQSKSAKQWPFYVGDEYGIPDDHYNLVDEIWSCDNVLIDGKPFGIADNSKVEFIEIGEEYPKRGVKFTVEDGINRNYRLFAVDTDTTKKMNYTIFVSKKVEGDTANQGSSNTVPVLHAE